MIKAESFLIINLIFNFFNLINLQLNDFCLNFDSKDIYYLSTNNRLISYYKQSFNETYNKLIYQEINDLKLNFNLNPVNINNNYKEKIIFVKKGLKIKIYLYLNEIKVLSYKNSIKNNCLKKENFLENKFLINCIVKYYDHCWFGKLSSKQNSLKHDSYVCLNQKETFFYDKFENKTIISANFFKEKIKGIALVDIKEFKSNNWLLFKRSINSLHKFDENWKIKNLPFNYQPNKIFFNCTQPFCLKATFDDLVYDSLEKQLIIYRGKYYFKINISENNFIKKKLSIDYEYLKIEFAKTLVDKNKNKDLYYFDAVEIISNDLKTYRIHIKNDLAYFYDHKRDNFLFKKKLKKVFPELKSKFVDSMFYKNKILNILSGNKIYSYVYNWEKENFFIIKQNYHLKLPSHIESSFVYNNKIYFFKENHFYISSENNQTLGPLKILDNFLINCNQVKYKNFFNLEEEYILSAENFIENDNFFNNFTKNLIAVSLISIIIVLSITFLVIIFAFFELLTPKRKSCYQNSFKNKGKGLILKPVTSSSENDKEFVGLIMKNRMRFSKNSDTATSDASVE